MSALLVQPTARPRPARRRLVATLASLAVAVTGFTGVLAAAPAQASTGSDEAGFVARINAARESVGRPRYTVSSDLTAVARRWAETMASSGTLRHNPNLATQVTNWRFVGENVGVGYDVPGLHQAFMNSPMHRSNILDSDFSQVGIGVAYGGGRLWVAEVFRKPTWVAAASRYVAPRATVRFVAPPAWATFRVGSRGIAVQRIQRRLGVRADGIYGPQTRTAVVRWQRSHHWRATGVVTGTMFRVLRA